MQTLYFTPVALAFSKNEGDKYKMDKLAAQTRLSIDFRDQMQEWNWKANKFKYSYRPKTIENVTKKLIKQKASHEQSTILGPKLFRVATTFSYPRKPHL